MNAGCIKLTYIFLEKLTFISLKIKKIVGDQVLEE